MERDTEKPEIHCIKSLKRAKPLLFIPCSLLTILLLGGCGGASVDLLTSIPTVVPSQISIPSPVPTGTSEPTATPAYVSIAPLVTAPYIEFGSWSPDSQWIAYWVSSQENLETPTNSMPGGTLNFMNAATGETCAITQFLTLNNPSAKVYWSDDLEAIIAMGEETFAGRPCQDEPYRQVEDFVTEALPNLALSPDGEYHADTVLVSSENGVLTFETTITAAGSDQPAQRATWQIDERLGEYGLGGEWISKEQLLIYETLEQGPLILDVEQGVTPVLTELLGLDEIPSITGTEGYGLSARAFPGTERDSFHLIVLGVGMEANFPSLTLHHAENGTVETLPFRYPWGNGFSDDGQWLLMDERPDIGGYEAYTISIRPVEDVDGEWRLIATDINSVLWNEDWSEMAFNSDETVIWQTFPEAEQIGQWETGPFWTSPVAWSPDGRSLVTVGNNPGLWEYSLFILER
ncbi:MAG TPA: hypothetical protein VJ821_18915 [Anaerolineales bacterium]|nr:hypothetical protein [Anaerolineales bacterium]